MLLLSKTKYFGHFPKKNHIERCTQSYKKMSDKSSISCQEITLGVGYLWTRKSSVAIRLLVPPHSEISPLDGANRFSERITVAENNIGELKIQHNSILLLQIYNCIDIDIIYMPLLLLGKVNALDLC